MFQQKSQKRAKSELEIDRVDISYCSRIGCERDPVKMLDKIQDIKLNETITTPSVLKKSLYTIKYQPNKEKASAFWDRFDQIVRIFNNGLNVQKLSEVDVRDAMFDAIAEALLEIRQV